MMLSPDQTDADLTWTLADTECLNVMKVECMAHEPLQTEDGKTRALVPAALTREERDGGGARRPNTVLRMPRASRIRVKRST